MRNILLIEPGYKNKYPPIGLMKIATYHRMLGDTVSFFKGKPKELVLRQTVADCMEKLNSLTEDELWNERKDSVEAFIKTGRRSIFGNLMNEPNMRLQELWLQHFAQYYRKKEYLKYPKYDRIYVTTLFTFYWKETIETIQEAKYLVKDIEELKVGGVMASLLPLEIEDAVGVKPITGLLDAPGILDRNDIVIDDLPLDYSILDEIDYQYPTGSAYFTFMTKGCTRTCSFCSVPKLEPTYKEKIPTVDKFHEVKSLFGEQQHLLLMDNNVLASPKFPEIIDEIKSMGFVKGAKYVEPNQLDIAIRNLEAGVNDRAYVKRSFKILQDFLKKRMKGDILAQVQDILNRYALVNLESVTKPNLIAAYPEIKEIFEKHRSKVAKQRFVDFNQGTDARYVTEEYMRMLSEIPIFPLRIAFDHINLKKVYVNAVRLAAKYGIKRLSNYLLFNFKDRPEDLYARMRINVDLSQELGIEIYSFPMKYIPLFGEEAKHRRYIGVHWNRKFLRAIQSISNATRGIVPAGKEFFERAYGSSIDDFMTLLYMPEHYILFRKRYDEELGLTQEWRKTFRSLAPDELETAKAIIGRNEFDQIEKTTSNRKIQKLLLHYRNPNRNLKNIDREYLETKLKFDEIIAADQFIDLTLTYDYESPEYTLAV